MRVRLISDVLKRQWNFLSVKDIFRLTGLEEKEIEEFLSELERKSRVIKKNKRYQYAPLKIKIRF